MSRSFSLSNRTKINWRLLNKMVLYLPAPCWAHTYTIALKLTSLKAKSLNHKQAFQDWHTTQLHMYFITAVKTNLWLLTIVGKGKAVMQLFDTAFIGTRFIKSHRGIVSPLNDKFYTKFQLSLNHITWIEFSMQLLAKRGDKYNILQY